MPVLSLRGSFSLPSPLSAIGQRPRRRRQSRKLPMQRRTPSCDSWPSCRRTGAVPTVRRGSAGGQILPHGIFTCINCAQLHRGIGRHVSRVKVGVFASGGGNGGGGNGGGGGGDGGLWSRLEAASSGNGSNSGSGAECAVDAASSTAGSCANSRWILRTNPAVYSPLQAVSTGTYQCPRRG